MATEKADVFTIAGYLSDARANQAGNVPIPDEDGPERLARMYIFAEERVDVLRKQLHGAIAERARRFEALRDYVMPS